MMSGKNGGGGRKLFSSSRKPKPPEPPFTQTLSFNPDTCPSAFGKFPEMNVYPKKDMTLDSILTKVCFDLARGTQLPQGGIWSTQEETLAMLQQQPTVLARYSADYTEKTKMPFNIQEPCCEQYVLIRVLMDKIRRVFENPPYSDPQCVAIYYLQTQHPHNPTYSILYSLLMLFGELGYTFVDPKPFFNPAGAAHCKRETIMPSEDENGVGFEQRLHVQYHRVMLPGGKEIAQPAIFAPLLDIRIKVYIPLRLAIVGGDSACVRGLDLTFTIHHPELQALLPQAKQAIESGGVKERHQITLDTPSFQQRLAAMVAPPARPPVPQHPQGASSSPLGRSFADMTLSQMPAHMLRSGASPAGQALPASPVNLISVELPVRRSPRLTQPSHSAGPSPVPSHALPPGREARRVASAPYASPNTRSRRLSFGGKVSADSDQPPVRIFTFPDLSSSQILPPSSPPQAAGAPSLRRYRVEESDA